MSSSRRIALLDRDGTIIYNRHYLADPAGVELLPGAAEGLRRMCAMGWELVLITNQSGIGRGYFTEETLQRIHRRFESQLAAESIQLDGIYFCPHAPEEDCDCRKPRTGMVDRAARELGFDLGRDLAVMIGDSPADMDLAANLEIPGIFVLGENEGPGDRAPAATVPDLVAAAEFMRRLPGPLAE